MVKKYSVVAILFLLATITIPLYTLQTKSRLVVEPMPDSPYYRRISRKLWKQRRESRKRKEKIKTTDIWSAIENNDTNWIQKEQSANPNFATNTYKTRNKKQKNQTPLHAAVKKGRPEIVEPLTEVVDISATDTDGNTALHTAAQNGNQTVYKILASKDANLPHTAKNINGKTANDLLEENKQNQPINKIKYILAIMSTWVSNFIHAEMYPPPLNNTQKPPEPWYSQLFDTTQLQHKTLISSKPDRKKIIAESNEEKEPTSSDENQAENNLFPEKIKSKQAQGFHGFYRAFREKAGPNFMQDKKIKKYYEYLKQMPHRKRMHILKNTPKITPGSVRVPSSFKEARSKETPTIQISTKPGERPIDHFACWVIVRSLQLLNFLWKNKYTGPTVDIIIDTQIEEVSKAIQTEIETQFNVEKIRVKKEKENSSDDTEYEMANITRIDLSPLVNNLSINKKRAQEEKEDAEHKEFVTSFIKKNGSFARYSGNEQEEVKTLWYKLKLMPHAKRMNMIDSMKPLKPGFSHYSKEEESEESDEVLQKTDPVKEKPKKPGLFKKIVNKVTDVLAPDFNLDDLDLTGAAPGVVVIKKDSDKQSKALDEESLEDILAGLKPIEPNFVVKIPAPKNSQEALATQIDIEESNNPSHSKEDLNNNKEFGIKEKEKLIAFKKTFWNLDIDSISADEIIQLTQYFKNIGVLPHEQRMLKLKLKNSEIDTIEDNFERTALQIRSKHTNNRNDEIVEDSNGSATESDSSDEPGSDNNDDETYHTCSESEKTTQSTDKEKQKEQENDQPTTWMQSFMSLLLKGRKFSNEHKTIM